MEFRKQKKLLLQTGFRCIAFTFPLFSLAVAGMMGSIEPGVRQALIRATLHLVNREYNLLAEDFVALGLLPRGSDMDAVIPALTGTSIVCDVLWLVTDLHHAHVCDGCGNKMLLVTSGVALCQAHMASYASVCCCCCRLRVSLLLLPAADCRRAAVVTGVFQTALAGGVSNISFSTLSADLGRTMYKYSFRLPPYYTLLVRSLSVLEGIALASDPNYKVGGWLRGLLCASSLCCWLGAR
jgi:hypothetical protein